MEAPTTHSIISYKEIKTLCEKPASSPCVDLFCVLPLEIKFEIFSYFSPEVILRLRIISRNWNTILAHDTIWKLMSLKVFGKVKKEDANQLWYSVYRSLSTNWLKWDTEAHHPDISIDSTGKKADCDINSKNDTHLPLRGNQGVLGGRHYFEVSFLTRSDLRTTFSSLLCAVGVADQSFPTHKKVGSGYIKGNNGIGYYSSGFQFLYGKEVEYGSRITYKVGNTVGFLLDMEKELIQFYKDRKPVGNQLHLCKKTAGVTELYPLILSERGLIVTINHAIIPENIDPFG